MAIDMLIGAAQNIAASTAKVGGSGAGALTGGASGGLGIGSGFSQLLEGVERSATDAN